MRCARIAIASATRKGTRHRRRRGRAFGGAARGRGPSGGQPLPLRREDLEVGGVHQSVDTLDALDEFTRPADSKAERAAVVTRIPSTRWISHAATASVCTVSIGATACWRGSTRQASRFDPLGAQQRRGRQAGDNPASARPQPGRDRPLSCGKLRASRDVDGRVDRCVELPKLSGRQRFGFNGFPPAQRPIELVAHDRSVPPHSDTTRRLCRFVHRFAVSRTKAQSCAA
jgi:hypothetical protein